MVGRSTLEVWESSIEDSGVYTCSPSNALADTVTVHVLTGNYGCHLYSLHPLPFDEEKNLHLSLSLTLPNVSHILK